jgi:signal transduction histidine kinase/ligand-binding sensor domain-containing protein
MRVRSPFPVMGFCIKISLVIALFSMNGYAQEYPFKTYNTASPTVTAIFQDAQGYMWIGMRDAGISRYNSKEMHLFADETGAPQSNIEDITQDGDGHLWIATEVGLSVSIKPLQQYLNIDSIRFDTVLDSVELAADFRQGRSLIRHVDGSVWYATGSVGIIRYYHGGDRKLHADTIAVSITNSRGVRKRLEVTALASASNGNMWAALENGLLWRFDDLGIEPKEIASGFSWTHSPSSVMYSTMDGELYGASSSGTLWKLEGSERVAVAKQRFGNITCITEDQQGRLLVGIAGAGIKIIDPENPALNSSILPRHGLLDQQINTILVDREYDIWIGQYSGLSKLKINFRAFTHYTSTSHGKGKAALPSPEASAVVILDKESRIGRSADLVVGTTDGAAFMRSSGASDVIDIQDGLLSNIITGISQDQYGRFWISTLGGINCLGPSGRPVPSNASTVQSASVWSTSMQLRGYRLGTVLKTESLPIPQGESRKASDIVLALADTVVYCAINRKWMAFDEIAGLPQSGNTDFVMDENGYLYIANKSEGIFRSTKPFTSSAFEEFETVHARMFEFPFMRRVDGAIFKCIWRTSTGASRVFLDHDVLWVGTDEGLAVITSPTSNEPDVRRVIKEVNTKVSSFAKDPTTGNIWVGTKRGIAEINPATKKLVNRIAEHNGLLDNISWNGTSTVAVDKSGILYQASRKGLTQYDPKKDVLNRIPPKIVFQDYLYQKKEFGDVFSISYLGLSFADEDQLRYKTRLVGYDDNWSEATQDTDIRFTNLLAIFVNKEYRFEVIASNNDGVWAKSPTTYTFEVEPPWWLRWYSLILLPLFIFGVIHLYNRYRTKKLATQNRKLESIVLERTKEISEKAEELETLDDIVKTINHEQELEKVLDTIVMQAMKLFPAVENAAFAIWKQSLNRYCFAAVHGYDKESVESIQLTEPELYSRYIDDSEQIGRGMFIARHCSECSTQEKFAHLPTAKSMLILAEESEIRHESLLVLDNLHSEDAFDTMDVQKLGRFREHAVSAINKAQTLEDIKIKNDEIVRQQEQLITQEKLASLGSLTAGIAHEIKNPLNFVNNFAKLSGNLLVTLEKNVTNNSNSFDDDTKEEVDFAISNLKLNVSKIYEHGSRADSIVKNMMRHSSGTKDEHQLVDVNSLVEEFVNLSFHGMRAQHPDFNVKIQRDYDESIGEIVLAPHDISRVVLNIVNNGCYAAWKKVEREGGDGIATVQVGTYNSNNVVEIRIRDNGDGIPEESLSKIFIPFYTTKPTGEGTGLGLSMSYEIVTKEHHGELSVVSIPGEYTEFLISLPKNA